MPVMANVMSKSTTRVVMVLVCAFMMLGLIWVTSRDALASLHASGAAKNASLISIDKAISLSGSDTDAHLLRGALLEANDDLASAIIEYEQATALRPEDYVLWLTLARARIEWRAGQSDCRGADGCTARAFLCATALATWQFVSTGRANCRRLQRAAAGIVNQSRFSFAGNRPRLAAFQR